MTRNASFVRKVIYGACIVGLLIPLFLLGQPATRSSAPEPGSAAVPQQSAGGKLAQLRTSYGISQAELGKIDPAGETMKMATLGLRGVATNLLWLKANKYKKTESWDKLAATLNQLKRLQPNHITVWEFQAHNLSYNVSAEFDNYEHRYHWVKRGIDFLMEGTQYNQRSPRLFWNLGWFTGQKIGRADEYRQFRRMFRDDKDFHDTMVDFVNVDKARGPDGLPDNWLVGHLWFLRAEDVVGMGIPVTWLRLNPDVEGLTDKRKSSVLFYSDAPKSLINHASAILEDITPGEKTRAAWKTAGDAWQEFGKVDIPTTSGDTVRLNEMSRLSSEVNDLRAKLDELSPGLRDKVKADKLAALSNEEREALANPEAATTRERMEITAAAFNKSTVNDVDLVQQMPAELRPKADRLLSAINEKFAVADRTISYGSMVNYAYWLKRCEVEQTRTITDARRLMLEGDTRYEAGDPESAKGKYEQSFELWAEMFHQNPDLVDDTMAEELSPVIERYRLSLEQLDEKPPDDFKLRMLLNPSEFQQQKFEERMRDMPQGTKPPAGTEPGTEGIVPPPAPTPLDGPPSPGNSPGGDKS